MNKSHASSRDLYESSTPLLNELTDLCRRSGALGSRLTGAGWGGCCVSLVKTEELPHFLEGVKEVRSSYNRIVLYKRGSRRGENCDKH